MITDDEYLERVVAGIQSVATDDADVTWNDTINSRQFDVAVRFEYAGLKFLVLIEVKNRTRKALAADIDAFATKARDQNANKMVFVTSAGFQQGAITVAKRHGVELFTVSIDFDNPTISPDLTYLEVKRRGAPAPTPKFEIGEPQLTANIEKAELIYRNGDRYPLPDERGEMTYYFKQSKLSDGRRLNDIAKCIPVDDINEGETRIVNYSLPECLDITPADEYYCPKGSLSEIHFVVKGLCARPVQGGIGFDVEVLSSAAVYTNVITGSSVRYELHQLPLGVKRVKIDKFYFIATPLMYYYCKSINVDQVLWYLIESFQHGELIRMTGTQNIAYSPNYIEVSDRKTLKRLKWRLDKYVSFPDRGDGAHRG